MIHPITRDELKAKIDRRDRFVLLEVLPVKYYAKAHLPGAEQIDLGDVAKRAEQLIPARNTEVVVYCANNHCTNSVEAARTLESLGYTNIREYLGGKQDWIDAGYPTEGRTLVAPHTTSAV